MPTIVLASPKGGAGESTSAVLLATQPAGHGVAVTLIDANPNKPLSRWAELSGKPNNLTVAADVTGNSIIDAIETQGRKTPFVIISLCSNGAPLPSPTPPQRTLFHAPRRTL